MFVALPGRPFKNDARIRIQSRRMATLKTNAQLQLLCSLVKGPSFMFITSAENCTFRMMIGKLYKNLEFVVEIIHEKDGDEKPNARFAGLNRIKLYYQDVLARFKYINV